MRIAVIGSRHPSKSSITRVIAYLNNHKDEIDEVVTGGAFGMDSEGMKWAMENKIKLTVFAPVGWHNSTLCSRARKIEGNDIQDTGLGFNERNTLIINNCDFVLSGDYGNGTIDSFNKAIRKNLTVLVFGKYIPGNFYKSTPKGVIIL